MNEVHVDLIHRSLTFMHSGWSVKSDFEDVRDVCVKLFLMRIKVNCFELFVKSVGFAKCLVCQ